MNQKTKFIAAIIFALIIPIWLWFVAPYLSRISPQFTYQADVISLDNFYDEASQSFTGEDRSITRFSYEVVDQEDGILTIKNLFDVRTISGDPIFAVERLYGIDEKTGRHVPGFGDKDREGYLFAPKGLKAGEPFDYWHINYDGPAHMSYVGEELIEGVKVFHYESRYEGVDIDQSESLTFLPEVGTTRGVNLDPHLQIWVEPTSGRLVKYKDQTTAYYYDLETKKRLHPWNKFANTYQSSSTKKHAVEASQERVRIILVNVMSPLFLALVALSFFILGFGHKRKALLLIAIGTVALITYSSSFLLNFEESEARKIAIFRWAPVGNPAYDQNIQGFKDALSSAGYEDGKDVEYIRKTADANENIQRSNAGLIEEQKVDLIFSQTTPGTLILKEEINDIPIVFSIVTYPVEAGLINTLQDSGNNLVGTRNWVSVEDQLSVFHEIVPTARTIGFVHRTGEVNSSIQLEEMRQASAQLGMQVIEIDGANLSELTLALETADTVDSLYSSCDTLVQGEAEEVIIAFAQENKLPSFSCNSSGPYKGDLVGVVADFYQIGKLAGEKAALILEGATPASLSTDTVARPFIYVNQETADRLGILIPQNILAKAREVIK